MNVATISQWLRSPAELPHSQDIFAANKAWPWFIPPRLMAAAYSRAHESNMDKCLESLRLYGGAWSPAYAAVMGKANQHYHSLREAESEIPLVQQTDGLQADEATLQQKYKDASAPDVQPEQTQIPIQPPFTEDYFRHEGIDAPEENTAIPSPAEPQTLMVVMSFSEWLNHFKVKTEKEESEAREKRALRSMWQQEKLAAALEDEPDEIPEEVFEMAVSSITREESLASESLALILEKQEKWSAAAEMYRKLALQNPAKSGYFAARAEAAKKRSL